MYLLLPHCSRYYTGHMSTDVTWQTNSTNSEATEALAEKIGQALKGGEVIELVSDLGGGKTTFVRGLARGFGSRDRVASPTFTVSRVYESERRRSGEVNGMVNPNNSARPLEMHHFDFYRLHEPGIIAEELAEIQGDPDIVVVVEWAAIVQNVLPVRRLTVTIEQTANGTRALRFRCPQSLKYLLDGTM
jgi:tRNA threonylcarbamoyladenosine biosynthesis protein TsaE